STMPSPSPANVASRALRHTLSGSSSRRADVAIANFLFSRSAIMYIHIDALCKPTHRRHLGSGQTNREAALNTVIAAEQALLPDGWHRNVRVTIGDGAIAGIEWNAPPQDGDERCAALLPTVANLHSHAFQRAMAGLAEVRGPSDDTFW